MAPILLLEVSSPMPCSVSDRSERGADAMSWIWMVVIGAFLLGMNLGVLLMGILAVGHQE